ncbi:MAG: hypothetical protein HY043_03650 [Verrucomicrobia bacterium]|nr:hypothetical protein [Verrucomicrobiota bacterium]
MKTPGTRILSLLTTLATFLLTLAIVSLSNLTSASGGSGSGGGGGTPTTVDTIKVTKCYYDAPTGQMLIKASSSDTTARLFAYRPDGSYAGEVQNGGGNRYGGTPVAGSATNPGSMTIKSSSGGNITVPTTPFGI